MLKKLSLLTAMTCLLSGCTMTWETSDFTVMSPKPLDFTKRQYKVGKEVEGIGYVFVLRRIFGADVKTQHQFCAFNVSHRITSFHPLIFLRSSFDNPPLK